MNTHVKDVFAEAVDKLLRGVKPEEASSARFGPYAQRLREMCNALDESGTRKVKQVLHEMEEEQSLDFVHRYIKANNPLPGIPHYTGEELAGMDLSPPKYLVEGVIPEGPSLLAGPPKSGKTLLALNLCLAIACGRRAVGKVPVSQGRVLFLALEGSTSGIKNRMQKMTGNHPAPDQLHIARQFPPLAKSDEALELLRKFLSAHKDTRLVVIDTLQALLGGAGNYGNDRYGKDYETLKPLSQISQETDTSFIIVHHTNKRKREEDVLNLVSGSTGLTGAVDNVLVLLKNRQKNSRQATLTVIPREAEVELTRFGGRIFT